MGADLQEPEHEKIHFFEAGAAGQLDFDSGVECSLKMILIGSSERL